MTSEESEYLFSYGTLQDEAVQLATFGRSIIGEPDALPGYRQTLLEIRDAKLIPELGKYHINVQWTGRDSDSVAGIRFEVSREEIEQADIYEADADYKRVSVQLKSGTHAWVYVGVEAQSS